MSRKIKQLYNRFSLYLGFSFIIVASGAIISLLLLLTSKYYVTSYFDKSLSEYITCVNDEFKTSMTELKRRLHMYTINLSLDTNLLNVLTDESKSAADKKEEIYKLGYTMSNKELIDKFAIVSYTGEKFCFSDDGEDFEPEPVSFVTGKTGYDISLLTDIVTVNGKNYFVFGKKLSNYYSNFDMGYLECYVDEDYIYSMYKDSVLENSEIFISCNGSVISHKNKNILGERVYIPDDLFSFDSLYGRINSSKFISKYSCNVFSDEMPLDMISILYNDSYYKALKIFNTFIVLIFIFNIAVSVIISRILSGRLTASLSRLTKKLDSYPNTSLVTVAQNNEVAALENRFNLFEQQINELIAKIEDEKKKQQLAELAALQAQINPHFIYNALDSMSWIAKINKQEQIEKMSAALASYFRLGLHNGESIVLIRDEINHVKSYITIEQIRFPNKFTVEFDIDEDIYGLTTVKTILQPIVENCIKHGFGKLLRKGVIKIKGFKSGGNIIFTISDNGCGMDFDPLTSETASDVGGYGIKNVQNRILLEYGAGFGLFYDSAPQKGTTVTVKIKNTGE